jgi:hypothetical protein
MKKWIIFLCLLTLSNTILATTCPPGPDCGSTAADIETAPQVYWPRQNNNSLTNQGIEAPPDPASTADDD